MPKKKAQERTKAQRDENRACFRQLVSQIKKIQSLLNKAQLDEARFLALLQEFQENIKTFYTYSVIRTLAMLKASTQQLEHFIEKCSAPLEGMGSKASDFSKTIATVHTEIEKINEKCKEQLRIEKAASPEKDMARCQERVIEEAKIKAAPAIEKRREGERAALLSVFQTKLKDLESFFERDTRETTVRAYLAALRDFETRLKERSQNSVDIHITALLYVSGELDSFKRESKFAMDYQDGRVLDASFIREREKMGVFSEMLSTNYRNVHVFTFELDQKLKEKGFERSRAEKIPSSRSFTRAIDIFFHSTLTLAFTMKKLSNTASTMFQMLRQVFKSLEQPPSHTGSFNNAQQPLPPAGPGPSGPGPFPLFPPLPRRNGKRNGSPQEKEIEMHEHPSRQI